MSKQNKNLYYLFTILFFVLNIISTYFITTQVLNRYISPVSRTFVGEINAVLGNFSILLLIYIIVIMIFKTDKNRFRALMYISLFLNFFIFASSFYTYFYSSIFTFKSLDIFKNPPGSVSGGLFTLALLELTVNFRILIFVPVITLLIILLIYKKKNKNIDMVVNKNHSIKAKLTLMLAFVLIFFGVNLTYLQQVQDKDYFNIKALSATNAVQNYGVYPFYITELMGINFETTTKKSLGINSDKQLYDRYMKYNKNKEEYNSSLDGNKYSNEVLLKDSFVNVDSSLNLSENDSLTGIFEDKNLVLVHLESINYFLFEIPEVRERFTFLNKLFEESVVFENFYTSVGMGVSSDAEFSVLTGLDPNGYSTVYRDYEKKGLVVDSLPKLFNEKDYKSMPIHADHSEFYNRTNAYRDFIGFTEDYYSLEDFALEAGYTDSAKYMKDNINIGRDYIGDGTIIKTPWPSEIKVNELMYEKMNEIDGKKMMFPMYFTAHTPFLSNPYPEPYNIKGYDKLSTITKRYLEYAKYFDQVIESAFFNLKDGSSLIDPNNVYIFYSDHGSSLKNGDLSDLYNDPNMSLLEERRLLQQTLAFIYAPGEEVLENGINKGLIKGKQKLTRGNRDLYRTIGDLFNIFDHDNPYFGTHGLSNEPGFVFDNRIQDVIIDDVSSFNNKANYKPVIVSFRNNHNIAPKDAIIKNQKTVYEEIIDFKKLSDLLLNDHTVYKDFKKSLQKVRKNL